MLAPDPPPITPRIDEAKDPEISLFATVWSPKSVALPNDAIVTKSMALLDPLVKTANPLVEFDSPVALAVLLRSPKSTAFPVDAIVI